MLTFYALTVNRIYPFSQLNGGFNCPNGFR